MLSINDLAVRDGISVRTIHCTEPDCALCEPTVTTSAGVVVVQQGAFIRAWEGQRQLLDVSMAYMRIPGQMEQFAHPQHDGDVCLVVDVPVEQLAELCDPEKTASATILLDARTAITQRSLLSLDPDARVESALSLLGRVVDAATARPSKARPRGSAAQALVEQAREALVNDPSLTLGQLAHVLSASPHHLSRTFCAITGRSVSQHRSELRIRAALDRLLAGEENIARLAADLGFADHAHLTRTLRQKTGVTPSHIRAHRHLVAVSTEYVSVESAC